MAEEQQVQVGAERGGESSLRGSTSTFTPFLSETARLQALKNIYLDQMSAINLSNNVDRSNIIRTARNMFAELDERVASTDDSVVCNRIIESLISVNMLLGTMPNDAPMLRTFQDECYNFITQINQILQRAGLGYKLTGSMSELDTLAKALGADMFYNNKFGMPINYAMRVQAQFMCNRSAKKHLDNIWGIEGSEGFGKSTVALELATTICEINGIEFDLNRNVFFSEKREYVYNILRTQAKHGDVFIFDEAVNQASKKAWWKEDQVELMRQFTLMRFLGITALFCVPDIQDLDIVLRERRLQGVLSIPERSSLTVKLPNLNPAANTYQIEKYASGEMVTSAEELTKFMAAFDKNRVLSYYTMPIPESNPIWVQYSTLKNTSFRSRKMERKHSNVRKMTRRDEMILAMLTMIDDTAASINEKQVEAFSQRLGFQLNFAGVAKYISKHTGKLTTEIIVLPDASSKDIKADTFINLNDPIVRGFVDRLHNTQKENNVRG